MGRRKQNKPRYNPENDGETHINILANKAATELGRRLSHFYHSPFTHPFYGQFTSMEAFWYFTRSGFQHDHLRWLHGWKAKEEGRKFAPRWHEHFTDDIIAANYQKIIQYPDLANLMIESELPFTHYYVFQAKNGAGEVIEGAEPVIINPRESKWLVAGFEEIRTALKEGKVPEIWKTASVRYATAITQGIQVGTRENES